MFALPDPQRPDILELWLNIAEENPVAADESLDVIQASVSVLRSQPEMGRARPELADGLRSFPTRTPSSFFMCLATITCWSCVFCTMRGILTQITFYKQQESALPSAQIHRLWRTKSRKGLFLKGNEPF